MPSINFIPATDKQLNYIDILVIDLSLTLKERNFHLSRLCKRNIKAPDELSKTEASNVISKFKEWKENEIDPEDYEEFNSTEVPF